MAFKPATVAAPVQQREQAGAWINFYLPRKDGTRVRVSQKGLPLYLSRAIDAEIIRRISEDDKAAESFVNSLIVEVNIVGENPESDLDF